MCLTRLPVAAGYAGWGCTDASHATSDFQLLLGTLLLTISNVLFAPAVVLALRRRFYTEALVYAFTMFFSTVSAPAACTESCRLCGWTFR